MEHPTLRSEGWKHQPSLHSCLGQFGKNLKTYHSKFISVEVSIFVDITQIPDL